MMSVYLLSCELNSFNAPTYHVTFTPVIQMIDWGFQDIFCLAQRHGPNLPVPVQELDCWSIHKQIRALKAGTQLCAQSSEGKTTVKWGFCSNRFKAKKFYIYLNAFYKVRPSYIDHLLIAFDANDFWDIKEQIIDIADWIFGSSRRRCSRRHSNRFGDSCRRVLPR